MAEKQKDSFKKMSLLKSIKIRWHIPPFPIHTMGHPPHGTLHRWKVTVCEGISVMTLVPP